MNVSLTPALEAFIESEVTSGQYASNSEVVRESLRLLQRQQELLRAAIEQGRTTPVISAESVTLDTIKARAHKKS